MGKQTKETSDEKWRLTVRFPAHLEKKVNARVDRADDRTVNWWIVKAVEEKLAREETA